MRIGNPHGVIKIRFDGFISCLIIQNPKVVDWPDHGGSVARYFACFPKESVNVPITKEIDKQISSLTSIDELIECGFLNLLDIGEYEIELWEGKQTTLLYNTNILNSNKILYNWHKEQIGNYRGAEEYSLQRFYPYGRQLMFTQPFESLDPIRIEHYENVIKSGERPKAISLRVKNSNQQDEDSYQNTEYDTTKYILDGHHKLVAYQNLNINPSYFVITRTGGNYDQSELPNLDNYLFYYQIEHIVNNCLESMRHLDNISDYFDNWITNTTRIKDTLIKTLYRNSYDLDYQRDTQRMNWFQKRLKGLINKINNSTCPINLDYYCSIDYKRKHLKIAKWNDVLDLLKLNYG